LIWGYDYISSPGPFRANPLLAAVFLDQDSLTASKVGPDHRVADGDILAIHG
jgi:hypothetical protein